MAHAIFYQVFVGEDSLFVPGQKIHLRDVNDGTSNTLAVITAAEAVPWTKPADLPYAAGKPLPSLVGGMFDDGLVSFSFADGSVMVTRNTIDADVLRALITRNGGEVIDTEKLKE